MSGWFKMMGWVRVVRSWRIVLFAVACLGAPAGAAEPLGVGDGYPATELADQHGEVRRIDADVRVVLFSRDMEGGAIIRKVLEEDPALLERYDAVYVSDVSGMPGFVLSVIAKPKMRRRAYPVLLDETGEATAVLPSQEGRPTVLWVESGRILRIAEPSTPEELVTLLASGSDPGKAPAAAD